MKEDVTEKRPYEAPQLTSVTFKAERGYATSGVLSERRGYGTANELNGTQQTWGD